jgi:outer membrane protein assembly factor BamB
VNSSDRSIEWSYSFITTAPSGGLSCAPAASTTALYTTPVIDGDMVYVGTYSGQVLALSVPARGLNLIFPQQRYGEWEWDAPLYSGRSNAIVGDLLVTVDSIYVNDSNGRVYSLDKEFGDQNWESPILDEKYGKLWTSPVIQGDSLYVGTFDGHIYSLSAATGARLDWTFQSSTGFASSPVLYGDTIFLGSFDRHLYAVGIGADEPAWTFPQDGAAGKWFWAPPVIKDGIVYAGCLDGKIYAVNATTGKQMWVYATVDKDGGRSPVVSSPVLADNFLLVANEGGNLYVFDLGGDGGQQGVPSNSVVQIGDAATKVMSSFCAEDGFAYIRDENNSLYIVNISTGQVSSPIPLAG